jgi:hypothetical protein
MLPFYEFDQLLKDWMTDAEAPLLYIQTDTAYVTTSSIYVKMHLSAHYTLEQWSPGWGGRDVPWGCGKKINHVGQAPI